MSKKFVLPILLIGLFVLSFAFLSPKATLADKDTPNEPHARVCPRSGGKDSVDCDARVIVDKNGQPKVTTLPSGYGPFHFRSAYGLGSGTVSTPTTIAIVDAYDHPTIFSDVNTYSSTYKIPGLNNCTITSGTYSCFQKVNQNGGTNYPQTNAGWALEIALDVEATHAVCQNCNILLVEANSNSYSDLMAAVDRAVAMGANVISNSYGSNEFSGQTAYDFHFNQPGHAFTFSSGDSGYGAEYPASSPYVTAVGGTTLNMNGTTYINETAWNGTGSGCSAYSTKPSWQHDGSCANRTVADVSADADPNTGAAVYDSVRYQGKKGWFKVGGTSLASPLIAGVYALSGNTTYSANQLPYLNQGNLHDITTGSNGSCNGSYLCTAIVGYDGPTGLGTPNGTLAF